MQNLFLNVPLKIASQISQLITQAEKESLKLNLEYVTNIIEKDDIMLSVKKKYGIR